MDTEERTAFLTALLLRMNPGDFRSMQVNTSHKAPLGKYEGIDIILEKPYQTFSELQDSKAELMRGPYHPFVPGGTYRKAGVK